MADARDAVKAALERVFDTVRAGQAAQLAPLLVVNDPQDPLRHLRKPCDYDLPHDRRQVDALLHRMAEWLQAERIVYGEFLTSAESEGEWQAWEVSFRTGPDGPRRYFGFLLVEGQYRLGDIDQ